MKQPYFLTIYHGSKSVSFVFFFTLLPATAVRKGMDRCRCQSALAYRSAANANIANHSDTREWVIKIHTPVEWERREIGLSLGLPKKTKEKGEFYIQGENDGETQGENGTSNNQCSSSSSVKKTLAAMFRVFGIAMHTHLQVGALSLSPSTLTPSLSEEALVR